MLIQEVIHEVMAETGCGTAVMVEERSAWARAVEDRTVQLVLAEGLNDGLGWDWESSSELSEKEEKIQE